MPLIQLPRTHGCLVCGTQNPHGLHLVQHVDPADGTVRATFIPLPEHIGFDNIIHGGLLATLLDEAMVWAATWKTRRFCVCGELTIRYRKSAAAGTPLTIEAKVWSARSRLIETIAELRDDSAEVVATANGKYVPVPEDRHRQLLTTMVPEDSTREAARLLTEGK